MLSRISPFWNAVIAALLYSLIQSGRRSSDAIGWDIAYLAVTLVVVGAALYKVAITWRTGQRGEAALWGAAAVFMLWVTWDTLRELHIL